MPVAVRRAIAARPRTNEAAGPGQRSARSDRRGTEALDVISVSPVPGGPFGHDLRYGRAAAGVNGFVHELGGSGRSSFHEFRGDVDEAWTSTASGPPVGRLRTRQPPIANISIRGRRDDVASVRSSE